MRGKFHESFQNMLQPVKHCIFYFHYYRPALSGTASTVLLQALALFDILRLWVAIPIQWTRWYQLYRYRLDGSEGTSPDISNESEFLCEWHDFFTGLTAMFGSWTIVLITIFRVTSVGVPHKAKIWCTKLNAYIAVLICMLFGLCICIPIPFTVWSFEAYDYQHCKLVKICQ